MIAKKAILLLSIGLISAGNSSCTDLSTDSKQLEQEVQQLREEMLLLKKEMAQIKKDLSNFKNEIEHEVWPWGKPSFDGRARLLSN
jgi:chromosome segregation ATPase